MTGIKIYDPYTDSFIEHDSDAFTTLVAQSVIDERNRWLDVLDKIKAEVASISPKTYPFVDHIDDYVKTKDVLKIIDKYRITCNTQR